MPVSQALTAEYGVNSDFCQPDRCEMVLSMVSLIMNEAAHLFMCLWGFFSNNSLFIFLIFFSVRLLDTAMETIGSCSNPGQEWLGFG